MDNIQMLHTKINFGKNFKLNIIIKGVTLSRCPKKTLMNFVASDLHITRNIHTTLKLKRRRLKIEYHSCQVSIYAIIL